MSKFFNYVKKFLSLSFMSAMAAFCLSIDCTAAVIRDNKKPNPNMRLVALRPISSFSPIDEDDNVTLREANSNLGSNLMSGHGRPSGPLQSSMNSGSLPLGNAGSSPLGSVGSLPLGSAGSSPLGSEGSSSEDDKSETTDEVKFVDLATGNIYFIKNAENGITADQREALWIGSTSKDEINIPAKFNVTNNGVEEILVTGAVLGDNRNDENNNSDVSKLTIDSTNFKDGAASIKVDEQNKLSSLSKVVIENNESSGIGIADMSSGDLQKLLERNSKNGLAAWYINQTDSGSSLVGESGLAYGDKKGNNVEVLGASYKKAAFMAPWCLSMIPNQSTVVIPASFVDRFGNLHKVEGIDLKNDIRTDKIQEIIITNIQDADHLEKIMKCAKLVLPGFDNGKNDAPDWILAADETAKSGLLTFVKVTRELKPIIVQTLNDVLEWGKDEARKSETTEQKLEGIKTILDRNFEEASETAKKMKDILKEMLDSFVNTGAFESMKSALRNLQDRLNSVENGFESSYSDNGASSVEDESDYSYSDEYEDESAISDESDSSYLAGNGLGLSRPDPLNSSESSDESSSVVDNESSKDNISSTGNLSDEQNSSEGVKTADANSSKLSETIADWQSWYTGAGKDKTPREQYTELKNRINAIMNSLSADEQAQAKKLIEEIDDALAAMDAAEKSSSTSSTSGTSSSTGKTYPSTTSSVSSASTKTSDSNVSPELLSLILSGSLAGLGVSFKKHHE